MRYSQPQLNAAIDVEVDAWARFFNVTDTDQIEARRRVMRANVACGYIKPLLEFLPQLPLTAQEYYDECVIMLERQPCDWHIGAVERMIIAECHRTNRPITSAVAYVMKRCNNS